ncbi:MAG: helix-turn-helix transcriptional regulator [Alphaproteobacteria bacterium]|nr:helix-turn-helix transcriptional regulator [Alphaproteobacteria bacterium]
MEQKQKEPFFEMDERIGLNVKRLRKAAGHSQKYLAGILNVSFQQVQKYEKGRNRLPVEKLYMLKNYYDVPYETFFAGLDSAGFSRKENQAVSCEMQMLIRHIKIMPEEDIKNMIIRMITRLLY